MYFKSLAFLCLLFVIAVQANYKLKYTKTAEDCMTETKIDETTLRTWMTEKGIIEDTDKSEKFFECCMRTYITDTNELVIDDKFTTYITDIFTNRLDDRRNLAKVLVTKCIDHCKDTKDVTKGKTAIKTLNCLMTTLNDIVKKDTE